LAFFLGFFGFFRVTGQGLLRRLCGRGKAVMERGQRIDSRGNVANELVNGRSEKTAPL